MPACELQSCLEVQTAGRCGWEYLLMTEHGVLGFFQFPVFSSFCYLSSGSC